MNSPEYHGEELPRAEEELWEKENDYPFDGIIVFGHGYSAGRWKLSWEAWARATAAYELWKEGIAPRIILTGGDPTDKHREKYGSDLTSNAEVMRDFLIGHFKVPENCLIIEDRPGSTKTVDNVGLALNALEKENLPADNFVTVSTGFHLDRITSIMQKYGLKSQPISAESELNERARRHAETMKLREIEAGKLSESEIKKRYLMRASRYDRAINRVKLKDPSFLKELQNEPKWLELMQKWGYWGPLALSVKGGRLKEIVENNMEDVVAWLERHSEIELSIEDLILGNFNYQDIVEKGREVPE